MPDGLNQLAAWATAAVAIAGGAVLLWRLIRGLRRIVRMLEVIWEDWTGVPDRDGVPGHPGVMARLARIEHELYPNSGASLRDAVNRIEQSVTSGPAPQK